MQRETKYQAVLEVSYGQVGNRSKLAGAVKDTTRPIESTNPKPMVTDRN